MNDTIDNTTYYLDWFDIGKRQRKVYNHRVLFYGNFFMHEARNATMKNCHCITDSICTNKPLKSHLQTIQELLEMHTYSLVVLGEGVSWKIAPNCEHLEELQKRNLNTKFVLATIPGTWMLSKHYQDGDTYRKENNNRCREISRQTGTPCLDVAAWADEMGLSTMKSAKNVKLHLAWSYLKQFRISKAIKTLRSKKTEKSLMQMANLLLAMKLADSVKKTLQKPIPTPEIVWVNKWHRKGSTALMIGDSNMRVLSHANEHLSQHVDLFATSLPTLAKETTDEIYSMLHPNIKRICLSIGSHHLPFSNSPHFESKLKELITNLQQQNREVLMLTLTDRVEKRNLTKPDTIKNAHIAALNQRMKPVAEELGVPMIDFHAMMQGIPYVDHAHYIKPAYQKPAAMIAEWLQNGTISQ